MRATSVSWWCPKGHKNDGSSSLCDTCGHSRREKHAQVHSSERAVVYINPATGERRTPARADVPIPEVYAQQGFERQEIMSMGAWEKQSGLIHEASNFNLGNEPIPEDYRYPKADPKVVHELAVDIAQAAASGPWTGGL